MFKLCASFLIGVFMVQVACADGVPNSTKQLVVAVSEGWDSSTGKLQCYNRQSDGSWKPALSRSISVLFGRKGLAWGRGLYGQSEKGTHKREGDGRTPAGVFTIGKVFGYDSRLTVNPSYPYRQVGKWDAWPDDVKNPYYNKHIVIDPAKGVPSWFEKQKMRHGDDAYRFLLEIRHNADPPKPGYGSAIFFHTRRGPGRTTAGCTTMTRDDLLSVIRWLRPDSRAHYLTMPKAEYLKRARDWKLPSLP